MSKNDASDPVYLIFDDTPDAFEFDPPEAWSEEIVDIDKERFAISTRSPALPHLGMHHTRPQLRRDNQTASLMIIPVKANSPIQLYGRSYTTNSSGLAISAENLAITYQPTDDQPGISFSEDAFAAINFGVAVAGEDAKMNETHIIVDDADTSQLLYFGDWNEDGEADDFSEGEGLVVGNNAQVRVGPRISYNGTRRATSIDGSGFRFRFWGHDLHIYGCFNLSRPDSRVVLNGVFQETGNPDVSNVWIIESPSNVVAPLNGTRYCETGHIVGMGFGATSEDEPKEMILTLHAIAVLPNPESASFVFDYLTYQPVFQRLSEKPQWDLKQLESDYVWKKPGPSKGTIIGASVGGSLGFLLIVGLVVFWVIRKRRGTKKM
ncbi:hypothetical protein CC1G_15277 [Coprinopsis cinerea okayama7|uniref:Uncharacterized protein n=1 Tax=Coprinopsis cinerea (strain Okayama-7 / 130 / ATCC MYA-4618 / FGSC 9003) TaxID=240176 RepID=D6RQ54_COPC7|nr:hypothetical protein CC1G_15277 [Coprinopsis cinerea okayama7\|eukprot:XP_002910370.1 hypothetical protein CC1G_15277 [Coprinopsis cinerea okayama7\